LSGGTIISIINTNKKNTDLTARVNWRRKTRSVIDIEKIVLKGVINEF